MDNNINNNGMPNENQNKPQYQSDTGQPVSGQGYSQQNNQPQYNQQQTQFQYGQPPYQQPYNYQPGNDQQKSNGSYGMAVASLVLGIFGVLFGCCSMWFINIPAAIAALVLGIMSIRQKKAGKGMAVAGIVLSSIALLIGILSLIATVILFTNPYLYERILEDIFGYEFYDMFKQFERYNNLY